jgi:hypothetical protein
MAYEIKKFPFRTNMQCMTATNTETGKACKFMVCVGQQDVSSLEIRSGSYTVQDKSVFIDSRSPTPGFPGHNEMSKEEVNNEFEAMAKAICDDLANEIK